MFIYNAIYQSGKATTVEQYKLLKWTENIIGGIQNKYFYSVQLTFLSVIFSYFSFTEGYNILATHFLFLDVSAIQIQFANLLYQAECPLFLAQVNRLSATLNAIRRLSVLRSLVLRRLSEDFHRLCFLFGGTRFLGSHSVS